MNIVKQSPNESGAYSAIQSGNFSSMPEGYAVWPDNVPKDAFYKYNGFVILDIQNVQIEIKNDLTDTDDEDEIFDGVNVDDGVDNEPVFIDVPTVMGCAPNLNAWNAWKSTLPPMPDPLDSAKESKLSELSNACNAAIVSGCDVVLSDGTTGHISLTTEDQINLTNAYSSVEAGAAEYPYHLDGELCNMYSANDIRIMAVAATSHKLYHTTYYNHLAAWVKRCESEDDIAAIMYGADLPEDLANNMATVLAV